MYYQNLALIILICLGSLQLDAQTNKEFYVFDGIMIKDKPNLIGYGFSKINIIYEDSLLIDNKNYPNNFNMRILSPQKFKREIRKIHNHYPICIDIESWLLDLNNNQKSTKKYINVLKRFKSLRPNNSIGLYGVLPHSDVNIYQATAPFLKNKRSRNWLKEWDDINANLTDVAKESDIAFPSCYTRYKSKELWLNAFNKQIDKIIKIYPGLKIYAFIWPQYYSPGFVYNNTFVDENFWEFQLEAIYKRCDGVVIWAPPFNLATREDIKWSFDADWFLSTVRFIKKHNIVSNTR